ncbi:CPBP family intramembrane metalloprotease [candidate division KSB1 bacterium]|nr:CPBP family intramembrane metalloprotease [candidate division KSB1 bacterium]
MARKSVALIYWSASRHPFYGLVSVLPVLIFYELIALTLNQNQQVGIRNAADVILKNVFFNQLLELFGVHALFGYGILAIGIFAFILWQKYHSKGLEVRPIFFIFMFMESLFYAVVLGPVIGYFTTMLQQSVALTQSLHEFSMPHKIMLSLGAGFYEELIFRVIILSGTSYLLIKGLNLARWMSFIIAALFSSILFSIFHYLGPFGEPFQFYSFFYRLFAGMVFAILYIARGFGIAVYTHLLYDLLIILSPM